MKESSVVGDLVGPLASGPLLLVSPHLDDAALSCAALLGREQPADVLIVFAGDPDPPRQGSWDRVTGFANSAESMPARRAEERAAFAGSRHRLHLLDLLEWQHLAGPRPAADGERIAAAVMRWHERNGGGVVALPAGAGLTPGRLRARLRRTARARIWPTQHPDHVFSRDAALQVLVPLEDVQLVLYEEFPYSRVKDADDVASRLARRYGLAADCIGVRVDRDAKAARIGIYATQVPHLVIDGRRVDRAQDLPPEERYWVMKRQRERWPPSRR